MLWEYPFIQTKSIAITRLELNITEPAGFTREVEKVRFLVRFGDVGVFKVIDEIERNALLPGAGGEPFINFYNDKVLLPVLQEEQNKLFTNLPRVAQAQAIASDRLFSPIHINEALNEFTVLSSAILNTGESPLMSKLYSGVVAVPIPSLPPSV